MARHGCHRGFSLIEILTALAVVAVLGAMAIPAWEDWIVRRRVAGVSAELLTDLQYLRSEAVKRNVNMRISFVATAGGSCYLLHTGSAGSCTCSSSGVASCTAPDESVKTVFQPAATQVSLSWNSASMIYSARRGTVTPGGTIEVRGDDGTTLRHIISQMGRVRTCSAAGALSGHSAC